MTNPFFIESAQRTRRRVLHPRSPKLLDDIRDAAQFIREVTAGLSLERYRSDRVLRLAV